MLEEGIEGAGRKQRVARNILKMISEGSNSRMKPCSGGVGNLKNIATLSQCCLGRYNKKPNSVTGSKTLVPSKPSLRESFPRQYVLVSGLRGVAKHGTRISHVRYFGKKTKRSKCSYHDAPVGSVDEW